MPWWFNSNIILFRFKKIILFSDKQTDSITINTGCAAAVSFIQAMEEEI